MGGNRLNETLQFSKQSMSRGEPSNFVDQSVSSISHLQSHGTLRRKCPTLSKCLLIDYRFLPLESEISAQRQLQSIHNAMDQGRIIADEHQIQGRKDAKDGSEPEEQIAVDA